jgi:hypothetical protein
LKCPKFWTKQKYTLLLVHFNKDIFSNSIYDFFFFFEQFQGVDKDRDEDKKATNFFFHQCFYPFTTTSQLIESRSESRWMNRRHRLLRPHPHCQATPIRKNGKSGNEERKIKRYHVVQCYFGIHVKAEAQEGTFRAEEDKEGARRRQE